MFGRGRPGWLFTEALATVLLIGAVVLSADNNDNNESDPKSDLYAVGSRVAPEASPKGRSHSSSHGLNQKEKDPGYGPIDHWAQQVHVHWTRPEATWTRHSISAHKLERNKDKVHAEVVVKLGVARQVAGELRANLLKLRNKEAKYTQKLSFVDRVKAAGYQQEKRLSNSKKARKHALIRRSKKGRKPHDFPDGRKGKARRKAKKSKRKGGNAKAVHFTSPPRKISYFVDKGKEAGYKRKKVQKIKSGHVHKKPVVFTKVQTRKKRSKAQSMERRVKKLAREHMLKTVARERKDKITRREKRKKRKVKKRARERMLKTVARERKDKAISKEKKLKRVRKEQIRAKARENKRKAQRAREASKKRKVSAYERTLKLAALNRMKKTVSHERKVKNKGKEYNLKWLQRMQKKELAQERQVKQIARLRKVKAQMRERGVKRVARVTMAKTVARERKDKQKHTSQKLKLSAARKKLKHSANKATRKATTFERKYKRERGIEQKETKQVNQMLHAIASMKRLAASRNAQSHPLRVKLPFHLKQKGKSTKALAQKGKMKAKKHKATATKKTRKAPTKTGKKAAPAREHQQKAKVLRAHKKGKKAALKGKLKIPISLQNAMAREQKAKSKLTRKHKGKIPQKLKPALAREHKAKASQAKKGVLGKVPRKLKPALAREHKAKAKLKLKDFQYLP